MRSASFIDIVMLLPEKRHSIARLHQDDPVVNRDALAQDPARDPAAFVQADDGGLIGHVVDERLRSGVHHRFRINGARPHASPQDGDHAGGAGAAQVLRQAQRVPRDLPLAGFAADLQHQVADLRDAGRAHGMAFRFQPAAGIDGPLARAGGAAGQRVRAALAALDEAEILACAMISAMVKQSCNSANWMSRGPTPAIS